MNQLVFFPIITPLLVILYLFPGFFLSRVFRGRMRNNPLFWVFLSLLFNGILYSFLAVAGMVSLTVWVLAELLVLAPLYWISRRRGLSLSFAPTGEDIDWRTPRTLLLPFFIVVFFFLVSSTKLGIFIKRTPIVADDYSQIPKVVSIAALPSTPKHFYYPLSNLSYYYYGQVSAGLLTRFSDNYVKANRSFVVNFAVQLAASLYLLWLATNYLFENFSGKLFFLLPLTFFGGFEFPVAFLLGERDLFHRHLEYWPGAPPLREMPQISNFTTYNIWAPHHLFSALIFLFLFLLLFKANGHRYLKLFFLSLIITGAVGFSFFSGLVLLATYLVFNLVEGLRSHRLFPFLRETVLVLGGVVFLAWPFLSVVGRREVVGFTFTLSRLGLLKGSSLLNEILDFLVGLPLYYFLELGILFVGLVFALCLVLRRKFLTREIFFWLIPLAPLFLILFVKFSGVVDLDFVVRSRSTAGSLLALAVFTGWAAENLSRRRRFLLLAFFLVTTLSPVSEFVQNLKTTPRAYTFFSDLDKNLPLNALVFTEQRAAPYFWPVPIFIHRPTVKPNPFWDQVDLQYTGLSAPPPDGLTDDDYGSVKGFLARHPFLRKDYQVYYLSLQKLDLPIKYQDLDYRLYVL